MDSSSHRARQDQERKDEIARKIAALQAELEQLPETTPAILPKQPASPKRKRAEPKVLAPETPSPRKKRKTEQQKLLPGQRPIPQPVFKQAPRARSSVASGSRSQPAPVKPSNVLKKLADIKTTATTVEAPLVVRSTSFAEPAIIGQEVVDASEIKRDERLALIQDFEPGPYEHTPPSDDPLFEKLEPHSNIALKSRVLPHEDFADHFRGRFYISPSQLYSSIRLQPDKQNYDVPVPGDWVTIAVVAERGPLKYTRAPVTLGPEEGAPDQKDKWKPKKAAGADDSKPTGRKYINMKLIDFGARTKSSATGGKAVIRGDAFLSLLLFEADSVDIVANDNGGRPEKIYRGGSRGAFEALEKLKEGDVIALLNPRILKPYQRANDKPHPVDNILAVTPESASSIAIIGRARDLGMCGVRKKDGKVCGSWCDRRQSEVCEYHIQNAVQHMRAARPEFTAGTGGMTVGSSVKRKNDYDPAHQWGLKPANEASGSTYIVSGHIVRGDSKSSIFMAETMGREGQAKAKRKLESNELEKTLKKMLERDREGMEVVLKAREASQSKAAGDEKGKGKGVVLGNGKLPSKGKKPDAMSNSAVTEFNKPKKAYSANVIRSLGFDPTHKPGHRRGDVTEDSQNKREKLEALCASKRQIKLGPIPGPKKRSSLVAPPEITSPTSGPGESRTVEIQEADIPERAESPQDEDMIDLDDF